MALKKKIERRITVDERTMEKIDEVLSISKLNRETLSELKVDMGKMRDANGEHAQLLTGLNIKMETMQAWKSDHEKLHSEKDRSSSSNSLTRLMLIIMGVGTLTGLIFGILNYMNSPAPKP